VHTLQHIEVSSSPSSAIVSLVLQQLQFIALPREKLFVKSILSFSEDYTPSFTISLFVEMELWQQQ